MEDQPCLTLSRACIRVKYAGGSRSIMHKFSIVAATLPPDGGTPEVQRIETTEKAIRRFIDKQGGPGPVGLLRGRAWRVRAVAAAELASAWRVMSSRRR